MFFLRFKPIEMFELLIRFLLVTALVKSSQSIQYRVHENEYTYSDSQFVCNGLGGTLAMPKTSAEQDQIIDAVNQIGNNQKYWMGLKRVGSTEQFAWADDESLTGWEDWRSSEPSSPGSGEDCVELYVGSRSSYWKDKRCSQRKRFICQLDDVSFPDNYTVEVLLVADSKAFHRFKSSYGSQFQQLSDFGIKYMLSMYMYNLIENIKEDFQAINVNIKTASAIVLEQTLDESRNVYSSLDRFKSWLAESNAYDTIKYDLAVLFTGVSFSGTEKGLGAMSAVCGKQNAAAVVEYSNNMAALITHEIGHVLGAEHDEGVMRTVPTSRSFSTRSRLQIRNNLELFYKDVYAMLGYDDCVNELSPVAEELNQDMDDDDKTPDTLCANVFGGTSYFCRSPNYYGGEVPSGDAMCQSFKCVVGYHTDCYQLAYTSQNTDGLACADGKTCQGWRCQDDPEAGDVDETCITGNQKYVTSHDDGSQAVTCEEYLERHGDGTCAGNYKIDNFDSLCCASCQERQHEADQFGCTYGEGKFPVEGGGEQTCAEYIDNSVLGRGLCNDEGFRSFCCQTCESLRVDSDDSSGSCAFGEPDTFTVGGQDMTCGEFLDTWGDSWCTSPDATYENRSFGEMCCQTCGERRLPEGSECPFDGSNAAIAIGGQKVACGVVIATYGAAVCPYYESIANICCSQC